MHNPIIINSTGFPPADRIIGDVVRAFEEVFPGRVRGYYLSGSYAEGAPAGILSDIDLCIMFLGDFYDESEGDAARRLARQCAASRSIRLDAFVTCETELAKLYPAFQVTLKTGTVLMYGKDIRGQIRLPGMDVYTRSATEGALHFIGRVLRDETVIHMPLDYPDPAGTFYGYDQKRIPDWYPETIPAGTKEMVACVSRIATAIVALKAKQYVGGKSESIHLYRLHVGDAWSDYLETLYAHLKRKWHYLIPAEETERRLLRQLCEQTLAFESHFLALYDVYLSGLADSSSEDDRAYAATQLQRLCR